MPLTYDYEIEGLDVRGNTWSHSGTLIANVPGEFMNMPNEAVRLAFVAITQGRAKFGNPGEGCRGPYEITRLEIKEQKLRPEGA